MSTLDATPRLLTEEQRQELARTWQPPSGFPGWFYPVNHRVIGQRYIVTALVFFVLGGIHALLMRIQLASPESAFVDPETYRQLFTMHGTTMMMLFAVPVLEGVGMYVVPLMIGSRDMALPRLNAFGYYVYLIAGVTLYVSFFLGVAPDSGWFAYPNLVSKEFSPGPNNDVWATMITFIEIAALVAAVELIVTVFKQRAPGMSLNRIPLFVWSMVVMSFMIIFAMPPLMVTSIYLAVDRTVGSHFFNPEMLGDVLLWQHLFWWFGHPDVYIILIPALGFVSAIVATFARRPLFGYTALVLSVVSIGIVSFGLWVHHMFATGLPELGLSFFTAASMMIAIPSGVQIFCWIATLWGGRPILATPLLFVLGFFGVFVAGGITGVMLAAVPFDIQAHDTYFVVAHFHYVLIGGMVFPLFGAFYYWFPKMTGRMLSETLGKWNFWLLLAGMNLTFFVQHALGFMGMPRRVHTYLEELGWGTLNLISTIGAVVVALSVAVFIWNVIRSLRSGAIAGNNPWNADTLEWATTSPPPNYNFEYIPVVTGRNPLWDHEPGTPMPVVTGLRTDRREALVTTLLDAQPNYRAVMPGPTPVPFLTALAVSVSFIGLIFDQYWVPIGAGLFFVCLVIWNWPREEPRLEGPDGPDHELARREREREEGE